jgi:hypothetical protein
MWSCLVKGTSCLAADILSCIVSDIRRYAPADRVVEGLETIVREMRNGLWADPQSVPLWEWKKEQSDTSPMV